MDALLPSSRMLRTFGLTSLLLFGCTEARISGIYKETESTDTAVTTPNTAPDCALLEPEDRSAGPEGATVFLTGTATDAETPNDQLTVDFESDQDGPLDSTAPTTAGDVVLPWSELSVGDHVLIMTVTDTEGAQCSDQVAYTVTPVETTTTTTPTTPGNAAPTAPIVRIDPADPLTPDALVAVIDTPSTDPDGDVVTYTYLWTVDGVDPSAGDVDRVDAVYTEHGQAWTVTVTPSDGALEGPPGTDTVTIGNSAPSVDAVAITPVPAYVGDTLTCSWTGFTDADLDPDLSYTDWYVEGTYAGSGETLTPDAGAGALVTCEVTPFDGLDPGVIVSATVVLEALPDGSTPCRVSDLYVVEDSYSTTENPFGCWDYGWVMDTDPGAFSLFDAADEFAWYDSLLGWDPVIWYNHSSEPYVMSPTLTWEPGDLTLHPGPDGERAVIRWTAPAEQTCVVDITLQRIDMEPGGDGVHLTVYHNDALLLEDTLLEPGGLLAFTTEPVLVEPGESLSVQAGQLGHFYHDTTKIEGVIDCDLDAPDDDETPIDCLDILEAGDATGDGVYWIDPDGTGPVEAWCDMTTDGGGWTLLSAFHAPETMGALPEEDYLDHFVASPIWIEGGGDGLPLSPGYVGDGFRFESQDWRRFFEADTAVELRQRAVLPDGTEADLVFDAIPTGHLLQDTAPDSDAAAWPLSNKRVLAETIGIGLDPGEADRFWLPFTEAIDPDQLVWTGCGGGDYEPTACVSPGSTRLLDRRYGNAGVINGTLDDFDPGFGWAPHMNTGEDHGIAYAHRPAGHWSALDQTLQYWTRRL